MRYKRIYVSEDFEKRLRELHEAFIIERRKKRKPKACFTEFTDELAKLLEEDFLDILP